MSEQKTTLFCPRSILCRLPDGSSDKENSHSRFGLPSHRTPSHRAGVQLDPPASAPPTLRRFDYVELSPVPASYAPFSANQREAGEGQGREHSQWQEERNTTSQWEALLSRKCTGAGSNQRARVEEEIEKKWAEFETLPLREMSSRPPVGSWTSKQSANEALLREVVCGDVFPICISTQNANLNFISLDEGNLPCFCTILVYISVTPQHCFLFETIHQQLHFKKCCLWEALLRKLTGFPL